MTIEDSRGNQWRPGSKYDEDCRACDAKGNHNRPPGFEMDCRICNGRGWEKGRPDQEEIDAYKERVENAYRDWLASQALALPNPEGKNGSN